MSVTDGHVERGQQIARSNDAR